MTRYDRGKHHRRSIRLRSHDYAQPGAYFVTIVSHDREALFADLVFRQVAETMWQRIFHNSPNVELDEWVVMPNHIHGITVIVDDACGRGEASIGFCLAENGFANGESPLGADPLSMDVSPLLCGPPSGSLGAIVGNFKSVTTRRINRIRKTPGAPVWQRNYYERVIRNQRELNAIRRYIRDNPTRWAEDRENLDR